MAEINSFYKSKYTGEQLDRALDNIYDSVLVDGSKPMTGALTIKKADNGHARFDKDHTATADAGTVVEDVDKNGNTAAILLRGADKSARLKLGATNYEMLHSGNIQPYIAPYAQTAEQAAEAAESALEGVREAINNIPEGTATPIVNDLTTGGASMALSAEMGKQLKSDMDELTYTDVDAAPAGYGLGTLGTAIQVIADCNDAIRSGWYRTDYTSTVNQPIKRSCWMRVDSYNATNVHQTWFYDLYGGCTLDRWLANGVWGEWEWVNPPMLLGVEYRTTERSEGKPVYAKRISYTPTESLTGVMVQSVPHNISEFGTLVRAFGRSKTFPLPYLAEGSKYTSILDVTSYAIRLQTYNVSWGTTYTWVFDIYYTKTTD